jgi:hypothetical protein
MSNNNPSENKTPVLDTTAMHMPSASKSEHTSHTGIILGILVVVLVLIFFGLVVWGGLLNTPTQTVPEIIPIVNNEPETPRAEADQQILEILSPSDEITAIDADVNSTNLDSLDTDITAIDAEFNQELQVQ